MGEGEERSVLERRVQEAGLENVRFLPFQPRERLAEVQATADVGLVTLAPGRGRTSVPSKVVGYMAAGRPVLASVDRDSDTASEIERGDCGTVVPPADPEEMAAAVVKAAADSDWRRAAGERARSRFDERYSRDEVLELYGDTLEDLLKR